MVWFLLNRYTEVKSRFREEAKGGEGIGARSREGENIL